MGTIKQRLTKAELDIKGLCCRAQYTNLVVKSADEAKTNDTTVALDSELQVELAANTSYAFKAYLYITSGTVEDYKYTVIAPTGATGGFEEAITGASVLEDFGTEESLQGAIAGRVTTVWGRVTTTDAGTFGISWAQSVSGATATTMLKSSHLEIYNLV